MQVISGELGRLLDWDLEATCSGGASKKDLERPKEGF